MSDRDLRFSISFPNGPKYEPFRAAASRTASVIAWSVWK